MSRFSWTLMYGKMRRPSGQWAIPRERICCAEALEMSSPSKTMRPAAGASSPDTAFRVVDFPAPLAPIRVTNSPRLTTMDRSRTALTFP